jgi:hypothetical protein
MYLGDGHLGGAHPGFGLTLSKVQMLGVGLANFWGRRVFGGQGRTHFR